MDISAIALRGLQQASNQLDRGATRIASFGAESETPGVDSVDLSEEMVALMSAKNQLSFNISVLKTADEVEQSVIDLLA